jgi:hypothetical protein
MNEQEYDLLKRVALAEKYKTPSKWVRGTSEKRAKKLRLHINTEKLSQGSAEACDGE